MLIKSALITEASGSIGGLTASRNKGGQYLKARFVPTNPNTELQQAARSVFAACSSGWTNDITQSQREAWNAYAAEIPNRKNALGASIQTSGQNEFVAANCVLSAAGLDPVTAPPLSSVQPGAGQPLITLTTNDITEPTLTVDNSELPASQKAWATVDVADRGRQLIQISKPVPTGVTYFGGPYYIAAILENMDNSYVLTEEYMVGQVVFLRTKVVERDGRYSNWVSQRIVVTEP